MYHFWIRILSGRVPVWAATSFFRSPIVSSSLHFTRTVAGTPNCQRELNVELLYSFSLVIRFLCIFFFALVNHAIFTREYWGILEASRVCLVTFSARGTNSYQSTRGSSRLVTWYNLFIRINLFIILANSSSFLFLFFIFF